MSHGGADVMAMLARLEPQLNALEPRLKAIEEKLGKMPKDEPSGNSAASSSLLETPKSPSALDLEKKEIKEGMDKMMQGPRYPIESVEHERAARDFWDDSMKGMMAVKSPPAIQAFSGLLELEGDLVNFLSAMAEGTFGNEDVRKMVANGLKNYATAFIARKILESEGELMKLVAKNDMPGRAVSVLDKVTTQIATGRTPLKAAVNQAAAAKQAAKEAARPAPHPEGPKAAPQPTHPAEAHATAQPTHPAEAHATAQPTHPAEAHATAQPTHPAEAHATAQPTHPAEAHATAHVEKPAEPHAAAQPTQPTALPTAEPHAAAQPTRPTKAQSPSLGSRVYHSLDGIKEGHRNRQQAVLKAFERHKNDVSRRFPSESEEALELKGIDQQKRAILNRLGQITTELKLAQKQIDKARDKNETDDAAELEVQTLQIEKKNLLPALEQINAERVNVTRRHRKGGRFSRRSRTRYYVAN